MTKRFRKTTALMLTFLLIFVSVFGSGSFVYAGGGEEEGFGSGKELIENGGTLDIDTIGTNKYYPASFKYAVQNMNLTVNFADGTSETAVYWQSNNGGYDGTDYAYVAYGSKSFDQYYMRFYDLEEVEGTSPEELKAGQVKICDTEVPLGLFKVLITRNDEAKPVEVVSIEIIDPVTQNPSGTTAAFSASDYRMYEETWYPLTLTDGKTYVFNADSEFTSYFGGIWYRDEIDDSVYNLDVGMRGELNEKSFTYTAVPGETAYLAIGETYASTAQSVTMSWQEKRTLKSIELKPAASHMPWKHDIETMPLKLTYTDGTTATEGNWMQRSFDATGNYDYVDGYDMTTTNGDTFYLSKYVDGTWQAADCYARFTPGSFNWRAVSADNQAVYDDATVKVASPSPINLKLEDGYYEDFSVSAAKSAAYTYATTKEETLQIINGGQKAIVAYTYFQPEGTNDWQYHQGELVSVNRPATINLNAGWKYMTILSCEESTTSGSIGLYSVGSTKSATVPTKTIKQDDFGAWAKLPITFNFTNPEGKSVGSQTIASWSGDYGYDGTGHAETRYGEDVFYQVYKDGKQVEIPFISEEMLALLNDQTDDEVKNMILLECGFEGGVEGLKLATGTYTVKVYLNRVADANVIGTGTVNVAASSTGAPSTPVCKTHTWNSGKVTKAATCTANGTKKYTCTKCGKTKTQTIYKASKFTFSTSTYTYNGKAKNPTITIRDSKGNKISTANYTVKKLTARKNVGKHGYKITFKKQYKGSKTVYFTIKPKATSVSKVTPAKKAVTVKWKKVSKQATGYEILLATNSKFTKGKKTVKVTSYKTTSKKVTKLKKNTKYWVKIRTYKTVNGKKYYSAWSKAKTVKTKK